MNQLASRSLANTTDCLRHLKEMCSTLTLPYHPASSPANPPTVTNQALFDINGQVLNMCLERQAGIQGVQLKIHDSNIQIQESKKIPDGMVSHPILSLCMTLWQCNKSCSNFMSPNPAGDSTGTGGDLGKVPFADRRGLWIQLAVAKTVLVGTSRIVNKLGTGRCGAIKVFQADTLRWKIGSSTVLCPMTTSK